MSHTKLGPIDQERLKEFDRERIAAIEQTLEKLRRLIAQNEEKAPTPSPNATAKRP